MLFTPPSRPTAGRAVWTHWCGFATAGRWRTRTSAVAPQGLGEQGRRTGPCAPRVSVRQPHYAKALGRDLRCEAVRRRETTITSARAGPVDPSGDVWRVAPAPWGLGTASDETASRIRHLVVHPSPMLNRAEVAAPSNRSGAVRPATRPSCNPSPRSRLRRVRCRIPRRS
jgi:hypothetical protein